MIIINSTTYIVIIGIIKNYICYKEKEIMNQIRDNISSLKDSIQRQSYYDITVIDIFTAFYMLLSRHIDGSITDDKCFNFLLGVLAKVPRGKEREFWFDKMFSIYEKLSSQDPQNPLNPMNPDWLLLQANLIYLAPVEC
jgi:hypothetical protein